MVGEPLLPANIRKKTLRSTEGQVPAIAVQDASKATVIGAIQKADGTTQGLKPIHHRIA